jgi:hypothetical protein
MNWLPSTPEHRLGLTVIRVAEQFQVNDAHNTINPTVFRVDPFEGRLPL